ncbi:MAG TPA: DUF1697 domain-containing protein [Miltoncostaeaceae bacterium]|nr:DUF1697 domain-containing protein [Miltoncostaeaceae bacterium]
MPRQVLLLRGVNVGRGNRIGMAELREALGEAGYEDVRTHLQSGNVILSSRARPDRLAADCASLIATRFGLDIDVQARSRDQLAEVVRRDPLGAVATEPKAYQVTFLAGELPKGTIERLEAAAAGDERVVAIGREVYAWHPAGVARSKLWALLAGRGLGVSGTSRNWTTVKRLLELAGD